MKEGEQGKGVILLVESSFQVCWMLLQPKKKEKFGSRREVKSIWAFQLTSNH